MKKNSNEIIESLRQYVVYFPCITTVVCYVYSQNLKLLKQIFQRSQRPTPQVKCIQISPVILVKASTGAILVTKLLTFIANIFLSVKIKSWKASFTITFENL